MANKPQQDDQETDEPKKGSSGLLVWIIVSVLALGLGFAVPYLLRPADNSDKDPNQTRVSEDQEIAFVDFEEVVVNLNEPRLNRYLRLKFSLTVDSSQKLLVEQKVEKNKSNLVSWLLSFLADKKMDDIRGGTGQNRMRNEIRNHFNAVLFPDGYQHVRGILFEEFNVQ